MFLCFLSYLPTLTRINTSNELTLSYNTTTADSFYIGEPLEVHCKTSQYRESGSLILAVRLGGAFRIKCTQEFDGWSVNPKGELPNDVVYTALTDKDCDLPNNNHTMSLKLNITEGLINLNITCQDRTTGIYADFILVIKAVKCE